MLIKRMDFVEIEYVGRLKENNRIFDLTSEELAKKEGIHNPRGAYGPRIICVGERHIVKGIDDFLVGKKTGKYELAISPEDAFGKKNAKLMKIVPMSVFKKQNLKPFPGLQVHFDQYIGTVKTVSGGRVIVDFNHPLAGRDVLYELDVKRIVEDAKEKTCAYLRLLFGRDVEVTYDKGIVTLDFPLPEPAQKQLTEIMKKVIPEIKDVKFKKKDIPKVGQKEKATTKK